MYVCVPHAPGHGRAHLELRKNAGSTSNDALDLDEGVEVCLANVTNGIENRQRPDPHVDVDVLPGQERCALHDGIESEDSRQTVAQTPCMRWHRPPA